MNEHPNITKLIGYDEDLMYYRRNGNSYKVVAIVMEIIPNGEIFDYIKVAVGFPESVARMYFRILIESKIKIKIKFFSLVKNIIAKREGKWSY